MPAKKKPPKKPARKKPSIPSNATYRQQFVCCGKPKCGKCRGVNFAHGPYWYAEWAGANGKIRTRYVGRTLPAGVAERVAKESTSWATRKAAYEELGDPEEPDEE